MAGKGGLARRHTLTLRTDDGVASLTLDRADRLNAMNLAMRRDLQATFAELTADPPDALIITGSGRAFCAGGDIDEFVTRTPNEAHAAMAQISHVWFRSLWQLPCPVIAAVNGVAAGGGLSMALAADIVYASPSAQFSCDFRSIGLTADLGALFLLPRLVGLRRSQELTLTGRRVGAQEAYELGMITSVVAADELLARATATARELQGAPAPALAATKRLLQRSFESSMDQMMAHELYAQAFLFGSREHRAGLQAFVGRRTLPEPTS
jgi:2-(1,2-epoxy-1,2-dihydrophenyl)acetyl-CoA isomerase